MFEVENLEDEAMKCKCKETFDNMMSGMCLNNPVKYTCKRCGMVYHAKPVSIQARAAGRTL